ncbi:GNAT family N-acetyltransferase [Elioraea sp. Yellowstone]|jgi:RimJ/RimL family protein N-acetyltransferase|uniref:GNAT family N-acetyltransferase n=1 Tax=Elioraea sp. Yellowstone TaxID=2592070 RepID=UPI00192A48A2|nr:GNAT family N-acetyltransferase [Elioraea sp. Yellowstone]
MISTPDFVPRLLTGRLVLRGFAEADLDAYAAMQADPEVMRHLGVGPSAGRPRTREESWTGMAVLMGQWALKGYGMFTVEERATGRFLGRAGILHLAGWPEPELAYALARAAWGRGFATEACRAALDWAWTHVPAQRIVSFVKPGNIASERVAARLGAVREGPCELLGVPCDLWVHRRVPTALA